MSHNARMERLDQITPEWLRDRLGKDRGRQARFAEAIGVKPDMVSKIMSGVRRLQPNEVTQALRFFGLEAVAISRDEEEFLALFRDAPPDRRAAVQLLLEYQLRQQDTP